MKKIFFYCISLVLMSCDDGDITVESINFDKENIEYCKNKDDKTKTTFFFKTKDSEALLLNLPSGLIKNATPVDDIEEKISTTSAPSLIYRLFTSNVSSAYFCDDIPPIEPIVAQETSATGGDITITTKIKSVTQYAKNYEHTINISNLSLANAQGERLTNTPKINYGDFTTDTPNSANLEKPFSNYEVKEISTCNIAPAEGKIRLYKLLNDEYISLDINTSLLQNLPTEDEKPRTESLKTTTVFRNIILNKIATEEIACNISLPDNKTMVGNFIATEGTVNVSTIKNEADSTGEINYTHTITLSNFRLTLKGEEDITLNEIETYEFGSITTTAN